MKSKKPDEHRSPLLVLILAVVIVSLIIYPHFLDHEIVLGKSSIRHGDLEITFEPYLSLPGFRVTSFKLTVRNLGVMPVTLITGPVGFSVRIYGINGELVWTIPKGEILIAKIRTFQPG